VGPTFFRELFVRKISGARKFCNAGFAGTLRGVASKIVGTRPPSCIQQRLGVINPNFGEFVVNQFCSPMLSTFCIKGTP
jgi:hypothetical protein